jgi:hypothetical protein
MGNFSANIAQVEVIEPWVKKKLDLILHLNPIQIEFFLPI